MRAHFLAGITLTIFLAVQAAYPQAAAESVLLNSNSATATVKAGTSLGNALNKAGSKLGNQVQTTVNHRTIAQPSGVSVKIERTPRTPATPAATASPATPKPSPAGNSLITSIQGGHMTRPSPSPAATEAK